MLGTNADLIGICGQLKCPIILLLNVHSYEKQI